VEIKIYAGYGHDQIRRYLRSLIGTQRGVVVAITRDVPTYGDFVDDDPRWAGSVQWRTLLAGVRNLSPDDLELAAQWPLFLDVLEVEGSMGFTKADTSLFTAWATYPTARSHLVDFVDSVRRPLLDALREALVPEEPADSLSRIASADVVSVGKKVKRVVTPKLGEIQVKFRVPADGLARIDVGVWGWGKPRFLVAVKAICRNVRWSRERRLGA
jgi:hypothetical protein